MIDRKRKFYILENGVKILFVHLPHTSLTRINTYIQTGMDHEVQKKNYECAHFLEHLMAQFTSTKYPNGHKTKLRIQELGGKFNASVNSYLTVYYLQGLYKNYKELFDMCLHTMTDFVIDSSLYEQEKKAVIQELKHQVNKKMYPYFLNDHKKLYSHCASKHKRTVDKRIESAERTTPNTIMNYYQTHYTPSKTMYVISGKCNESAMLKQIVNHYSSPVSRKKMKNSNVKKLYPIQFTKRKIITRPIKTKINKLKQSQLKLHFPLKYTFWNKSDYILRALIELLTHGLASILYRKMRQELGLVYWINSDYDLQYDEKLSYFTITCNMNPKNVKQSIQALKSELLFLKRNFISYTDLTRVKNSLSVHMEKYKTSNYTQLWNSCYTGQYLWNKPLESNAQRLRKYKSITKKDIQNICKEVFNFKNCLITYCA